MWNVLKPLSLKTIVFDLKVIIRLWVSQETYALSLTISYSSAIGSKLFPKLYLPLSAWFAKLVNWICEYLKLLSFACVFGRVFFYRRLENWFKVPQIAHIGQRLWPWKGKKVRKINFPQPPFTRRVEPSKLTLYLLIVLEGVLGSYIL